MNAKALFLVAAIFASFNTFAAGRDSVPAQPGTSVKSIASKAALSVPGRSTVYAHDLPVMLQSMQQAVASIGKVGRA